VLKLKINNVKIDFFAKKHAKVRRISDIPLPFYAYLTKKVNPDASCTWGSSC
jgi:hypothetical protein